MLVIGLGNPLRGDDGVGIWVAEHIAAANWPGVMAVALESSDPTLFFSLWHGFTLVYLVDAVIAPYPVGTILRLNLARRRRTTRVPTATTHIIDLWEILELARTFGELPPRLMLYGIVSDSFQFGKGLSPEVELAAQKLLTRLWRLAQHIGRPLPPGTGSEQTWCDTG
nr:hydrogenase maturation protease [Thermomicrobium sp. CFH 73360]